MSELTFFRAFYGDMEKPGWGAWHECSEEQAKTYAEAPNLFEVGKFYQAQVDRQPVAWQYLPPFHTSWIDCDQARHDFMADKPGHTVRALYTDPVTLAEARKRS